MRPWSSNRSEESFDFRPTSSDDSIAEAERKKMRALSLGQLPNEMRKNGVELIEATPWLKPLMPGTGFLARTQIIRRSQADVAFGFRIANETPPGIGQSV